MKMLVVLGALSVLLVPASSVESALPPALLTFGITYGPLGPTESGGGLCLARADGSRRVRLTRRNDDRQPAWSPRGRFVAFSRYARKGPAISNVLVADTRGRVLANVSRSRYENFSGSPAWSPDGRLIAFDQGWTGSNVMVVGRRGGNPGVLVEGAGSPEWFPDGTRLAFSAADGIYSVHPDGTDRRLLVEDASLPEFSPDGRRLAFVRRTGGPWASEVFVANADGSDPRPLTDSSETELDAAWSPDGRLLAITRWDHDPYTNRYWIVVLEADTGEEYAVIRGPHSAFDPEWRPAVSLPRASRRPCR